ncbi:MAG: helix-turn-helix transcriptional regulator [Chloroflexi bacterium]|nr:helix-turn-helix transcriptional regulator [Chloroflexota bacterium]
MDDVGFGRGLKALRIRKSWTQDELAREAKVSRGVVARIEQGHASKVTVQTLDKVAGALGARVTCRLSWNGEELGRLLDAAHAAIVEQLVGILQRGGWLVATEVSFNIFGERGSIDILAFHPATRVLLVVEVKSVVPDVQATLVTLDRKERLSPQIGRGRGWDAVAIWRLLVIKDDRTARRRIEAHAATFGNAFPDRAREVRRWLAAPHRRRPLRGLWFLSGDTQAVARQRVRRRRLTSERGSGPSS